jgi:pSer/pThr/pTyr-binding forkhead associated (FHA) protein
VARTDQPPYTELTDPVSEQRFVGEAVSTKLRYRQALITLRAGKLYLGRSPECELAISDPAVSRRHARLWVSPTQIVIEDLGSQNGVHVNGERIQGPRELRGGDVVRICSHELELVDVAPEVALAPNRYRITGDTLSGADKTTLLEERLHPSRPPARAQRPNMRLDMPESSTQRAAQPVSRRPSTNPPGSDSLAAAIVVLDEALNLGDTNEAERRLGPILMRVHELLLEEHPSALELAEHVVVSAARFASATRSAAFMNYAVTLYQLLNRPLPEPAVNVIHTLVQAGLYPNLLALESYVAKISAHAASFDATELFLLDSLRRVVESA